MKYFIIITLILIYLFNQRKRSIKNLSILKNNWKSIKNEAINRMENSIITKIKRSHEWDDQVDYNMEGWVESFTGDKNWFNYPLIYNYKYLDNNCNRCPLTKKYLKTIKKIKIAGYSWLLPNSGIPEHIDGNDGLFVSHLGLYVPDDCFLFYKKNNNWIKIKEDNGKIFSFDDSLLHYAVNNSNYNRIILYILMDE